MNGLYIKRIFLVFVLFYFPFCGANGDREQHGEQTQNQASTDDSCIDNYLKRKYLKIKEGTEYLSLKGECQEYKQNTAACCMNPNNCSGLGRDLATSLIPLAPAVISAYEGYRTSKDVSGGKLSHEEAVSKMCGIHNEISMGSFLSQLGLQASTAFEKSCGDKIKDCKEDCHDSVVDFKEAFKRCFGRLVPIKHVGSVDDLINYAKKCAGQPEASIEEIQDVDSLKCETLVGYSSVENNIRKSKTGVLNPNDERNATAINGAEEERVQEALNKLPRPTLDIPPKSIEHIRSEIKALDLRAVYNNGPNDHLIGVLEAEKEFTVITKPSHIKDILLFAKAYQNSSTLKDTVALTESSNGEEIVNCRPPDKERVVTERKGPGAPIPPPQLELLCHQAVSQTVRNNPSPQAPASSGSRRNSGTLITGGESRCNPLDSRCHGDEEFGVISDSGDEGDDMDFNNKGPGLSGNLARFSGASGGGSGGGGGGIGGAPAGGGGGPGSPYSMGEGRYGPSYGNLGGSSSYSGPGAYNSSVGGRGGEDPYPYRNPSGGDGKNNPPYSGGPMPEGAYPGMDADSSAEGGNIFQTASHRIQQFCSDYSCLD